MLGCICMPNIRHFDDVSYLYRDHLPPQRFPPPSRAAYPHPYVRLSHPHAGAHMMKCFD